MTFRHKLLQITAQVIDNKDDNLYVPDNPHTPLEDAP